MKFGILFFLFYCIAIDTVGQSGRLKIPLVSETNGLSAHKGYIVARTSSRWDMVKKLPKGCDSINSFLKRLKLPGLGSSVRSCDSLFILFVGNPPENNTVIIDENKNFDFTDDSVYKLDIKKQIEIFVRNFSYMICSPKKVIQRQIDLYFSFDPGNLVFNNEKEKASFVAVGLATYQKGQFKSKSGIEATIEVFMRTPALGYDNENTIIRLYENNLQTEKELKIGDIFYLGNKKYKLDKIDKFGTALYISQRGNRSTNELGIDSGFFAPNFKVSSLNGDQLNLKRFHGRYVLLDFWGTWCGPCIASIPGLQTLKANYPKLELISIAAETEKNVNKDSLQRATKKYGMNWNHVYQSFHVKKTLMNRFKINSYPTTLLIDPKGKIIFRGGSARMSNLFDMLQLIYKK